jgi:hypothetical protein
MKKIIIASFAVLSVIHLHAQQRAVKVILSKGQKITMTSHDTSAMTQKRGEESMDMKTVAGSTTQVEIIDVSTKGYAATATLQKMKIDFDGYGQKMKYDSESKEKQEGMMAEQMKNVIGKTDTLAFDLDGKKEEEENKSEGKGKGNGKGGGMMKMLNQGGANIENAFLIVPAEATEGSGWKKDATKDNLRSQTIYFVEKINGNIATVSFKKKTKGSITRNGGPGGGEMKIDMDNLSDGLITVDMSTGLVKTYTEKTNSNSKTFMMGNEMPSTGTTISDVTFE